LDILHVIENPDILSVISTLLSSIFQPYAIPPPAILNYITYVDVVVVVVVEVVVVVVVVVVTSDSTTIRLIS
jgi:hypothetical protein